MDTTRQAKDVSLSLPKLVLKADFSKIVALAASGDIKQLKAAINSSLGQFGQRFFIHLPPRLRVKTTHRL